MAIENKKPTPAFLKSDYPYQAIGDEITDFSKIVPHGVLYEIKCPQCEMSIRTQGVNIEPTYKKLIDGITVKNDDGTTRIDGGKGCVGCGNKKLVIREVDMSKKQ